MLSPRMEPARRAWAALSTSAWWQSIGSRSPAPRSRSAGSNNPASAAKARAMAWRPSRISNICAWMWLEPRHLSRAVFDEESRKMLEQSNELSAWDRDHFFHPSTHMGMHARGETPTRVIGGGEGVYITDTSGRTSLDAF